MVLLVLLFTITRKTTGPGIARLFRRAALCGLSRCLGGYGHQARTAADATARVLASISVANDASERRNAAGQSRGSPRRSERRMQWHVRCLPCGVYGAAEVGRLPARFHAKICSTFAHSRCGKIGCRCRDPIRTKHVRNLPTVTMTADFRYCGGDVRFTQRAAAGSECGDRELHDDFRL
jgi:hypothetical protein